MTIRPAALGDVPAVLPLVRKISDLHQQWDAERFGLRGDPAESYDGWLRRRAEDPRGVFLVAESDDRQIVGYLVGTIESEIPIYWMPECGWIHDLWVDESYRHEGLGRQMAMLAIERFAALGVRQIRLQTASANDAGRKLFESCGFRACTVEMLLPLQAPE
jgi:ribosomal protein S18 acetylase RimI-like enzyme